MPPHLQQLAPRLLLSAGWDVVLIDGLLPGRDQLVAAAVKAELVIVYDGAGDAGIDVLSLVAAGAASSSSAIKSLSILSHGSPGRFALGNEWVSTDTLHRTAAAWAALGGVLVEGANVLLYGCNVADAPGAGQELLDQLAELTGAAVSASDDTTGSGGDWVLEATSRGAELSRESAGALDTEALGRYTSALAKETVRDEFNTVSYKGNDGTQDWANRWKETGESDGPDEGLLGVSAGEMYIGGSGADFDGLAITRRAITSRPDFATLTFSYRCSAADGGVSITAAFSANGGSTWTDLRTYVLSGTDPAFIDESFDVSAYLGANNSVGFYASGTSSGDACLLVDNVQIEYWHKPELKTTGESLDYTEDDGAVAVDEGLTVTDEEDTELVGATATISGGYVKGQDVLGFTDQLGITGDWDPDTGVLTLSGTSSIDNYQTALRSITYTNTSGNPRTITRTVTFSVSDADADSAPAGRNITVTAVDDEPRPPVPLDLPDPPEPPDRPDLPESPDPVEPPAPPEGAGSVDIPDSPNLPCPPATNEPAAGSAKLDQPDNGDSEQPDAKVGGVDPGDSETDGARDGNPAATKRAVENPEPEEEQPVELQPWAPERPAQRRPEPAGRRSLSDNTEMCQELDLLNEQMSSGPGGLVSVGTATGMSAAFAAGYVIWLLRGGTLLTSLLSAMPLWKWFDPLPVLARWHKDEEFDRRSDYKADLGDEKEVGRLLDEAKRPRKARPGKARPRWFGHLLRYR